jgi:hypothetical protein
MTCYLAFINLVKQRLKVTDSEAEEILRDMEREVGHNHELIKALIDIEGELMLKRLKKRKKKKNKEEEVSYA